VARQDVRGRILSTAQPLLGIKRLSREFSTADPAKLKDELGRLVDAIAGLAAEYAAPTLVPTPVQYAACGLQLGFTTRIDPASGTVVATLPHTEAQYAGRTLAVLKRVATGTITVAARSTDAPVDGAASVALTDRGLHLFVTDGEGWSRVTAEGIAALQAAIAALTFAPTVVSWTSSTTWVVPAGVTGGWLYGAGGGGQGGGGARGAIANSTITAGGGAGGGGAEEQKRWVTLTPGETCTITIGAGGSAAGGGASSNGSDGTKGSNGTDTTFACAAGTFTFRGAQGGAGGPWSTVTQNMAYGGSTDRGAFGPPVDLGNSNFITVWSLAGVGGPGGNTGTGGAQDGFAGFAGRQGYAGGTGGTQGADSTGAGGSGGGGGGGGGGGIGANGGAGGKGGGTAVAGSAGSAAAANTGAGGGGGGGGGNSSGTSANGGKGGAGASGYLKLVYYS
jgi:hypothetical protein